MNGSGEVQMCFPRPIDSLKRYIDVCVIKQCTEKIMRNNTVEGQPSQTHQMECCDSDGVRIRESWGTRKNIDTESRELQGPNERTKMFGLITCHNYDVAIVSRQVNVFEMNKLFYFFGRGSL